MLAHHRFLLLSLVALGGCGGELTDEDATSSATSNNTCDASTLAFETGSGDGHADPFGAKAASQARAGRVQAAAVPQPAHGKQKIQDGDFVLANDKIAVFIEDVGLSDGYGRFGGEILAVDRVGSDGKPLGLSKFVETLQLTSLYQVDPTSVSVMNDGSDGNAAVVRVTGPLTALPFLRDTFGAAFPQQYKDLLAVYDYVLEPGEERLKVRFGFANPTDFEVDTGLNFEGSWNLYGFFQGSINSLFLPNRGFGKAAGLADEYVGFENDSMPFAYQGPDGAPLDFGGIDVGGFTVFSGPGFVVSACSSQIVDDHEVVVGEPHGGVDLLGEVVRRVNERDPWREVTGVVHDAAGAPVGGAFVHALDGDGNYLSRTLTAEDGSYVVHVPEGDMVLVPAKRGYPIAEGATLDAGADQLDLDLPPNGVIHVVATEQGTNVPIPVRIQVIPDEPLEATPESFGSRDEAEGRLWQEFSVHGDSMLAVPVGTHRVIVSRGYEWELLDTSVDVAAGQTVEVPASLLHSVDTTNAVSADFHIHSMYSPDSSDPVVYKVKGALADGLDCPVSSEHEWINDFQSVIEDLGAEDFAFTLPSEELTTFTWGHFGVIPAVPVDGKANNGAVDWLDKNAKDVFDEVHARPEHPALIVNHPSGDTTFQAYFTRVGLDKETGTSTDDLWAENFDAIEVCNKSSFDSNRDGSIAHWFALLNRGKTYFAVGSSDSHELRTEPVGYPRNYLAVGYDDPKLGKADDVRDAVMQGHMVVTGGIYMTVEGPDASGPGDTVTATGGTAEFIVTVRSPSWVTPETLETIVNGETISTEPLAPVGAGPGKQFVNTVTVTLPSAPRTWVIFHAKGAGDLAPVHPGRSPFAMSNPIFFQR